MSSYFKLNRVLGRILVSKQYLVLHNPMMSIPRLGLLVPDNLSRTRISFSYCSSSCAALKNGIDQRLLLWKRFNNQRRFLATHAVQPGAPPPPSQPPFNFIYWIFGVVTTVVLPFLAHQWTSIGKLKNEVDTAVETAEELIVAVEKVAEVVEKAAEEISDDLPQGGKLRKTVDFVEDVAERASSDARLAEEIINKVQEVENKVEASIETLEEAQAKLQPEGGGGHGQDPRREEEYDGNAPVK